MIQRFPTLFVTHGGGPCFFMDWDPADAWDGLRAALESIPSMVPTPPKAILLISAHWEEPAVSIEAGAQPDLVYDYWGFPAHTYELTYPAPGDPALANRVQELLTTSGVEARTVNRGWDHGVFIPLKVAYPDAEIPVVAVSLVEGLDPAAHLHIGAALTPLRDEGVLIIGSGSSYHNMRGGPEAPANARQFDDWLHQVLPDGGPERTRALEQWAAAPSGIDSHPREEHLIPLHVAVGAAAGDPGRAFFDSLVMSAQMSCWIFGEAD